MTTAIRERPEARPAQAPAPASSPAAPRWADVVQAFRRHHAYYLRVGAETIRQQLGGESSVQRQYGSRVAFELLQNAIDRAHQRVLVQLVDGCLVVANDGAAPLTVAPDHDYDGRVEDASRPGRADFQALCSLSTSNKDPNDSVGNKGVGFRSVFSVASRVEVWSRLDDGSWWGLEMLREGTPSALMASADPEVIASIWPDDPPLARHPAQDRRHPSFYFPLPRLGAPSAPRLDLDLWTTIVLVPLEEAGADELRGSVEELLEARLHFVGVHRRRKQRPPLSVEVLLGDRARRTSTDGDERTLWLASWKCTDPDLVARAKAAGHSVEQPGVAVAWLPATDPGQLFNFLPSQQRVAPGLDVHADFQMTLDRKGLSWQGEDATAAYNRTLLRLAAELHVLGAFAAVGARFPAPTRIPAADVTAPGPELVDAAFWTRLNPKKLSTWGPLLDDIRRLLFAEKRPKEMGSENPKRFEPDRWAALARGFFSGDRVYPRAVYDAFWEATVAWLDLLAPHQSGKVFDRFAHALLAPLRRDAQVPLIPLTACRHDEVSAAVTVERAFPLPSRIVRGEVQRAEVRIFAVDASHDDQAFDLPEALQTAGRALTTYRLPGSLGERNGPAGLVGLERWAVLANLRQLPSGGDDPRCWCDPLHQDPRIASDQQRGLIRLAFDLFRRRLGNQNEPPAGQPERYGWGWWLREPDASDARGAGRALGTLFLPTTDDHWEPARQLTLANVRVEALGLPDADAKLVTAFLAFLGVTPLSERLPSGARLVLVEGADDGLVPPLASPPALYFRSPGGHVATPPAALATLGRPPGAWLHPLLHELRPWLRALLDVPGVREPLATWPWVPTSLAHPDGERAARPLPSPAAFGPPREALAPREIVVLPSSSRLFHVVWGFARPPHASKLRREFLSWLIELGAADGLEQSDLRHGDAARAIALLQAARGLDLTRLQQRPEARTALIELMGPLVEAISSAAGAHCAPLPMLAWVGADDARSFASRELAWRLPDDLVFATDGGDRERLRRHFPRLTVATADVAQRGDSVPTWVQSRTIKFDEALDPGAESVPSKASEVRVRLERLLPSLFALAEATRIPVPLPEQCADRWRGLRLRQVERLTLHMRLTVPDGRLDTKDTTPRVAMSRPDRGKDESSIDAYFVAEAADVDLEPFADLLADWVLGNRQLTPVLAQALGWVDRDRDTKALDARLEREAAVVLKGPYERALQPLPGPQLARLRQALLDTLARCGLAPRVAFDPSGWPQRLVPDDLVALPGATEEADQADEQTLTAGLARHPDALECARFLPVFDFHSAHREAWGRWKQLHRRALLALLDAYTEDGGAGLADLDHHVGPRLQRWRFEPAAVTHAWLRSKEGDRAPRSAEALQAWLHDWRPVHFDPVTRLSTYDGAPPPSLVAPDDRGQEKVLTPATTEHYLRRAAVQAEAGDAAERAALEYLAKRTHELLTASRHAGRLDEAIAVLLQAVPTRSRTADALDEALTMWTKTPAPESLKSGLHVSKRWGNAGFDLLGLAEDGAALQAVCWETKAITEARGLWSVHLSLNQITSFRRSAHGAGRRASWRLVGVLKEGRAVDLTARLGALVAEGPDTPLGQLRAQGLECDSLVVWLTPQP